jgi:hypothetical protein
MVGAAARAAIALAGIAATGASPVASSPPTIERPAPVRSAFARAKFPWYDPASGSARPVWPPGDFDSTWLGRLLRRIERWLNGFSGPRLPRVGSAGDLIVIGLVLLALTILLVVLIELWRRYRPTGVDLDLGGAARDGSMAHIEGLPEGVRPGVDDPWAEAQRRRERGDHAGAIVCLFAHQLLTLDRLGLVRLAPGRTARQLVRSIADRALRADVEPTLRLFEAVYYGHRTPSAEKFEAAWAAAEAFQGRVAEGVPS